jgi:hypothetical protein
LLVWDIFKRIPDISLNSDPIEGKVGWISSANSHTITDRTKPVKIPHIERSRIWGRFRGGSDLA